MCARGRGRSPHAKGTVDMYPRTMRVSAFADLPDGIKGSGVHIACLHAHYRAVINVREHLKAHPSLCVDRNTHNPVSPESHERKRLLHARMNLVADHDRE